MSTPPVTGGAPAPAAAAPVATGTAPAAAQPTPTEIRKMKLNLNGQEVELPESEVIAYAQQGKVATERFKEASKMRQEAEQILKYAEANPEDFFKRTGKNARQWAEEFLLKELQAEAMSPEQRKARENEEKLRKYENDEKSREDKKKQEAQDRLKQEHMEKYDQMFVQALTESGLPKTKYTIKRMAELQLINIKNKYELSATQLAKIVREDYIDEQKSLYGAVEGDQLLELLGPEIVKKLSKAQIAKLKARGTTPAAASATPKQTQEEKGLTWQDWQKRNRGRG